MYVLPLIEVRRGESVHILPGPGLGEARPLMDPTEVAHRFQALGAQGFRLIDVDHAEDPNHHNDAQILSVIDTTRMPIEVGGGVHSLRRIQELLDTGARRVVVGTKGIENPAWLHEAALIFEDQLVANIDTNGQEILVHGRTQVSPIKPDAHIERLNTEKFANINVSFVSKTEDGIAFAAGVVKRSKLPVTYQGSVKGLDDLARLENAGVAGVIIGREFYDGTLRFEDVVKAYRVR